MLGDRGIETPEPFVPAANGLTDELPKSLPTTVLSK